MYLVLQKYSCQEIVDKFVDFENMCKNKKAEMFMTQLKARFFFIHSL